MNIMRWDYQASGLVELSDEETARTVVPTCAWDNALWHLGPGFTHVTSGDKWTGDDIFAKRVGDTIYVIESSFGTCAVCDMWSGARTRADRIELINNTGVMAMTPHQFVIWVSLRTDADTTPTYYTLDATSADELLKLA